MARRLAFLKASLCQEKNTTSDLAMNVHTRTGVLRTENPSLAVPLVELFRD